jgi:hypothetical protein
MVDGDAVEEDEMMVNLSHVAYVWNNIPPPRIVRLQESYAISL